MGDPLPLVEMVRESTVIIITNHLRHFTIPLCIDFPTGTAENLLPDNALASVALPPDLFAGVERDPVGVFFTLYTEDTLFPVRDQVIAGNTFRAEVASPIVAATVGPGLDLPGLDFPSLVSPVVINLRLNSDLNVGCVWVMLAA